MEVCVAEKPCLAEGEPVAARQRTNKKIRVSPFLEDIKKNGLVSFYRQRRESCSPKPMPRTGIAWIFVALLATRKAHIHHTGSILTIIVWI